MKGKIIISGLFIVLFFTISCVHETTIPVPAIASDFPIIAELPEILLENSGIILSDEQHLWAHNDSGSDPELYEISLEENGITKTVHLKNASHVDWESITKDDSYVYLGDTGNNTGTRTDLAIHKIWKSDLQTKDSIEVSTIFYQYADQTDFMSSSDHNFDCEAMIPIGDQIFLFTKNLGNLQTNIYTLPNTPGTYTAEWLDSFPVDGLLTDAGINDDQDIVCLLGYNKIESNYEPFVWILYDFPELEFLKGKRKRITLELNAKTEALCFKNNREVYFTSEAGGADKAYVYEFDLIKWL